MKKYDIDGGSMKTKKEINKELIAEEIDNQICMNLLSFSEQSNMKLTDYQKNFLKELREKGYVPTKLDPIEAK